VRFEPAFSSNASVHKQQSKALQNSGKHRL